LIDWLKVLGSAERPLQDYWRGDNRHVTMNIGYPSRRKPSVRAGELAVGYAAADKFTGRPACLFGVLLITSDPALAPAASRFYDADYAWRTDVRWLRSVDHLSDAPSLYELNGVFRQIGFSVRQQSHIELHPTEVDVIKRLFGDVWADPAVLAFRESLRLQSEDWQAVAAAD